MNPLDDIERQHGFSGLGAYALAVWDGAFEAAEGDETRAFRATVAVLAALLFGATGNGES